MGLHVGIDLGTTFSAVAVVEPSGRPAIIQNSEGTAITPSVIYFGAGEPVVGDEAKEMQALGESEVASFFKRSMGNPDFILKFNRKAYTPTDLSAILLKKIKADAEIQLGDTITHAVITVPAYFNNFQREATIKAGEMAGLKVQRIINEPTAAALAYGLDRSTHDQTVLVYDLGGGTFDVSIVNVSRDTIRVIGTGGDHELGGKDWDDRIANFLGQQFFQEYGVNPLEDMETFQDILTRTEQAKKQLSVRGRVSVSIVHEDEKESYEITRSQFEEMTRDLMERTRSLTAQALKECRLDWKHITGVLLVGGSTRMPMVRQFVESMSGKKPLSGVNVDEAVALGAAIQAQMDVEEQVNQFLPTFTLKSKKKTRDVMSHSLGLAAENKERTRYINSIIIPKNTPIPNRLSNPFELRTSPHQSNQLDVYMLQGESTDPLKCILLGKYIFSEINHVPDGPTLIDISYGHDQNGVVMVSAVEKSTGRELPLRVEPPGEDMSWLGNEIPEDDSPYTTHAGSQSIPGAVRDKYGNPGGSQYDLIKDNAFSGYTIAVLHLYTGEGFNFKLPEAALKEKGFKIHRWTRTPRIKEFEKTLDTACQLWVISSNMQMLDNSYVKIIEKFFHSGKGIYIWGDNEPYYADANLVMNTLFNCRMSGNSYGDQVVKLQRQKERKGFIPHLITTGLERLYEGITVASVEDNSNLQTMMYGSNNEPLIALYDKDGKRAIIDGGFTRLFCNWDTAGTGRYVKNAAGWLVNYERFQNKK